MIERFYRVRHVQNELSFATLNKTMHPSMFLNGNIKLSIIVILLWFILKKYEGAL